MSHILSIIIYLSLVVGVLALWKLTKALSAGKRWAILGLFGWIVLLMNLVHLHDYWVWYYNLHNAESFMREVAKDRSWFGEDSAGRERIIGLAFAHADSMGESSDNARRALQEAGINYGSQSNHQSEIETTQ